MLNTTVEAVAVALGFEIRIDKPRRVELAIDAPSWAVALRDELVELRADLLFDRNQSPDNVIEMPSTTYSSEKESRVVKVRSPLAAAGGGAFDDSEEGVKGYVRFNARWLRQQGLDSDQCSVIDVTGDSMEPTLPDGCSILVNHRSRELRDGGIFVVRSDIGSVVKRVSRSELDGWRLVSDNHESSSLAYKAEFSVIGEVKWVGRTL